VKSIARFVRKWWDGMRTLWGCRANPLLKIAALPVMACIALLCCMLDLIDGGAE
jgi:hypothetical protein